MTGPYQRRHPCSHLLPQRRIACTDGARGWACKQTLIDCAAGVRYALYCRQGLAASTVLRATGWVWVCAVCQAWPRCYVYHRLARRLDPRKRSVRSSCSACHERIVYTHPISIYDNTVPAIASARPSSQPAALCSQLSLSPLLGACLHHPAVSATASSPRTTRAVDSQRRRRALWRPWVAGCLGSAPHRLHRLCA